MNRAKDDRDDDHDTDDKAKYWYTSKQSLSAPYSSIKNCLTTPKIELRKNFRGMSACEHFCMCMYMCVCVHVEVRNQP